MKNDGSAEIRLIGAPLDRPEAAFASTCCVVPDLVLISVVVCMAEQLCQCHVYRVQIRLDPGRSGDCATCGSVSVRYRSAMEKLLHCGGGCGQQLHFWSRQSSPRSFGYLPRAHGQSLRRCSISRPRQTVGSLAGLAWHRRHEGSPVIGSITIVTATELRASRGRRGEALIEKGERSTLPSRSQELSAMRGFDWRSPCTGESERTAGKRCATPVAGGSQGPSITSIRLGPARGAGSGAQQF